MSASAPLHLEDLYLGQRFVSREHLLDEDQIIRFASEFDPQPFHTDPEAARQTQFEALAASGWHTAALTMRLMVESVPLAGGMIGTAVEIAWPEPTRPGLRLRVFTEVTSVMPSRSKPDRGIVTVRSETRDEDQRVKQILTATAMAFRRP